MEQFAVLHRQLYSLLPSLQIVNLPQQSESQRALDMLWWPMKGIALGVQGDCV